MFLSHLSRFYRPACHLIPSHGSPDPHHDGPVRPSPCPEIRSRNPRCQRKRFVPFFVTFCVLLGWGNVQVFSQPANDDKADAQVITGASGQVTGSTVGATKEIGEASHGGYNGRASVWFQWRAPDAGEVTFNTSGSSFDTFLAVYEGATLVAENDDDGTFQSTVQFSASQGHAYLIAIDGYDGRTGSYVLNWRLGASTPTPTDPTPPDPTPPATLAAALAALADAQAALETLEGLTHGLVAILEQAMAERDTALAAFADAEAAHARAVAERDAYIAAHEQQIAEVEAVAVAQAELAQEALQALAACEEARVQAVVERDTALAALAACRAGQM